MDTKPFAILLVGENAITSPEIMGWIENNNAHCEFALSCREACTLAAAKDFDVVLSEYHLPDRSALPLLDSLSGSSSTLYLCTSAEKGRLWLKMLEHGTRRHEADVLQTPELTSHFQQLLNTHSHAHHESLYDVCA